MTMIWFLLLLFIFIVLVMPIEFKVTHSDAKSKVEVRFVKLFDLQFEIVKFIKFFLTTKEDREHITLEGILYNMTLFLKSRQIIQSVCSYSTVQKTSLLVYADYEHPLWVVSNWILVDKMKNLIHHFFHRVSDEYYMVLDRKKPGIRLEVVIQMRIILAIFAILKNIKQIIYVRKVMKVTYGKSNL